MILPGLAPRVRVAQPVDREPGQLVVGRSPGWSPIRDSRELGCIVTWIVTWVASEGILSTAASRGSAGQHEEAGARFPKAVLWDMDGWRIALAIIRMR